MAVGQSGDPIKAGIVIQARLGSQRLPGKVLHELGGVPLLEFLIQRIESSKLPIIVASTTNKEDEKIVSLVEELNIGYFLGDEDNVLSRYYHCAVENNLDIIIRLTSDNPFLEGEFIATNLRRYLSYHSNNIYMATGISKTYPLGISMEIFSFALLKKAYDEAKDEKEKEHVTPYIYNKLPVEKIGIRYKEDRSHYRLTVDTPYDYELVKTLVEKYDCRSKSVEEIIRVIDQNEYLMDINKSSRQKKWNE